MDQLSVAFIWRLQEMTTGCHPIQSNRFLVQLFLSQMVCSLPGHYCFLESRDAGFRLFALPCLDTGLKLKSQRNLEFLLLRTTRLHLDFAASFQAESFAGDGVAASVDRKCDATIRSCFTFESCMTMIAFMRR